MGVPYSFFDQSFWKGVIGSLSVAALLGFAGIGFIQRIKTLALARRDAIVSWFFLTLFFFGAIVAYSFSQPRFYVPQEWPRALTKSEIQNWTTTLQPYHKRVSEVIIAFVDEGQKDFAASVAQALSDADWPEPSLEPNNYLVGTHIAAAKDVYDVGQELQKLMQNKVGPTRLDKAERATENPDEKIKTVPPGKIEIFVGWKPKQ
jgi:hypothetical protein